MLAGPYLPSLTSPSTALLPCLPPYFRPPLPFRQVWALRVDTHVLDHGGNLVDACCLSALAALMAFRKPEVTVGGASGTELIVHPPEVKEPLPLTIHHLPVSVTFGIFDVSMAGKAAGRMGPCSG